MKKNVLKVMATIFSVAFLMAGCATVSNVKIGGKDANFKEPVYNQGQVLVIGDYLYYGNGYTASNSDGFNYNSAAKSGYLARIDLSKGLTFADDVKDDVKAYTSPKNIEKVVKDRLIGYQAQDMFALGEYIYFSSPNTHKTTELQNDYTQVSLYRVKFNGDGLKELVKNSAFKQGEGSTITMQKGSDNNYYYIIVEPGENNTFTIKSLKIGNKIGKIKTIAEEVTSYAIADSDSVQKNIIFTTASEQATATTAVKSVDYATGEVTDLDNGVTGSTAKMLDRAGDIVFYSYSNPNNKVEEVYYKDLSLGGSYFNTSMTAFYNATSISDVKRVGEGYVFKTAGGALMYKELNRIGDSNRLMKDDEFTDILFVNGDVVYTSTDKTIKRVDTVSKNVEVIVTLEDTSLISGQCGYDGEYIYFYSNLPTSLFENEEGETNDADSNYYLFRTDMFGNCQIVGKRV